MSLHSILVHLNGDERAAARLRLAASVARQRGARLTGLFAQLAAPSQAGVVAAWPPRDYAEAAAASRAAFIAATQGLDTHWQDLDRGLEADVIPQFVDFSRHFDLIVLGQTQPRDALTPPDLAEQTIVQSGRPVLVLPHSGEFAQVGTRPIFAWSDSRCAARGFCDGMMLVAPGADAVVVSLSKPEESAVIAYRRESLNLAVAHLAAHGVTAASEQLTLSEIGLMDAMLNRAVDHGADLLALGAFGGGGYPLFSRGSGSRYMLKHMTLPVLFSH